MSQPVKTLGRNDKLSLADALMRVDRIRHLRVVDDDGQLVDAVSQRDRFLDALVRDPERVPYGAGARGDL